MGFIQELEEKLSQLGGELNTKQQELADVNKPEMTSEMYDILETCLTDGLQEALGNLSSDDLEKEFGMEYDGKVYLESIQVQEDGFVESVMGEINRQSKTRSIRSTYK